MKSWAVFNDFTKCVVVQNMLRAIDSDHYTNGRSDRDRLNNKVITQLQLYRNWAARVSKKPEEAKSPPSGDFPTKLQTKVLTATELKSVVLDWAAKAPRLPECFHSTGAKQRGGVIYGSASEAIILTMTAAREKYLALLHEEYHAMVNMFSPFHLISARTNGYYY
ncbi:hypothetical protein VB005_02190 [Metarhizium brunneum]